MLTLPSDVYMDHINRKMAIDMLVSATLLLPKDYR